MGVQNRLTWEARGRPFTLCRPLADLRDRLRHVGYTVYDIGNRDHLEHNPPEDHTPYSETGWPLPAQYSTGYAIDIMPPARGSGLPTLQQLGARLYADRQASRREVAWLKYMNWEPDGQNTGACWHDSWQPGHIRRPSGDRGHIHLSALTGHERSTAAADYDPVAWIQATTGSTSEGDDEMTPAQDAALSVAWQAADALLDMQETSDGRAGRPVRFVAEFNALRRDVTALGQMVAQLGQQGGPAGPVSVSDEQLERVLRRVLGMSPTG